MCSSEPDKVFQPIPVTKSLKLSDTEKLPVFPVVKNSLFQKLAYFSALFSMKNITTSPQQREAENRANSEEKKSNCEPFCRARLNQAGTPSKHKPGRYFLPETVHLQCFSKKKVGVQENPSKPLTKGLLQCFHR